MPLVLVPHPDAPAGVPARLEASASRDGSALRLRYVLSGALDRLRLPPPAPPRRADGLWQHTCFEAFVRGPEGAGYVELNFAPSTAWAAYAFDGYRAGMRPADLPRAPRLDPRSAEGRYELEAAVELPPDLPVDAPWRLGLSAVLEDADGGIGYFALAHAPGRPDFHHPASFALELKATP